ncbi:MAG: hypothetical protein OEZ02_12560 [Anaerolineae bacterium]|nr:hypothetical protein [Anaerolineae bacterium]
MSGNPLDLASIFSAVTSSLMEKKQDLNKADTHNNDHGDNMVEIFKVITQAMEEKQGASSADQLAYASELLRNKSKSGSAQMYSQGLAQASQQFKGKSITADNALQLVQSLLGGGQAPAQPKAAPSGGDLLGSLLGGLTGGGSDDSGFDVGDLLNAGLTFMQAKQHGDSTAEALIDTLIASSQMGQTDHRAQSSKLVTNTIMQLIGSMGG